MTQAQEAYLSVAKTSAVPELMREYGFEFAGPSTKDAFLFRDDNGKAWLLTDMRGRVAPCRMMLPSAWTEQNLAIIGASHRHCDHGECNLPHGHIESCRTKPEDAISPCRLAWDKNIPRCKACDPVPEDEDFECCPSCLCDSKDCVCRL